MFTDPAGHYPNSVSWLRQETSQCAVIVLVKIQAEKEPYTMDFTQIRIALAKPVCCFHGIAGHAVLVLIKNLCGTALTACLERRASTTK